MDLVAPSVTLLLLVITIFAGVIAFVVWLIAYRLREKENETFEKRDN